MRHYFFPALVWTIGLITSQIIFSIIVYISNISLYHHLTAIRDAGYLIVPNLYILNTLKDFSPAFYGALFFSLTTGAGITLVTFVLIMLWKTLHCHRIFLFLMLLLWGALIAKTNLNRINLAASIAMIIIPIVVAYCTFMLFYKENARSYWMIFSTHCIILVIVFVVWIPHLNKDTFISFRDYLLLGNSIGQKINNFYYSYTMYPAEVFKSIDQKTLKSCVLQIDNRKLHDMVEDKLRRMDYLELNKNIPSDVKVLGTNQRLMFIYNENKIIESTFQEFISNPDKIMTDFSERCDKSSFFRKITFLSLVAGLPVCLYILLQAMLMWILFVIPSPRTRFIVSSVACFMIGVSMTLPFYHDLPKTIPQKAILNHLHSEDWRSRTAALKKISDDGIGIDQFMNHINHTDLTHIPEKYWFAKALAASNTNKTLNILHEYLDDPNPNVVCMALYSLGKRNQPQCFDKIIQLVQSSTHWYIQWYAYKALKRMGWVQPKSTDHL